MSDERAFGKREGLGERLAYWANQLSVNKQFPWIGTGIIDDLKLAAKIQGADYSTLYPSQLPKPQVEYDL